MKNTKKALISAVIAVLICCTMFVGSTFAWFTDQAESKGNKVVAGDLEMELKHWTSATDSVEITKDSAPLFMSGDVNGSYWEPGKTEVRYLSIANVGTLDIKYTVAVNAYDISDCVDALGQKHYFNEVMYYDIVPNAKYGEVTAWGNDGANVSGGINATEANNVRLEVETEHFFALVIHMDEDASSIFEKGEITFDIKVIAGQLASETDAFGSNYDELATYPDGAFLLNGGSFESNVAPGAEATAGANTFNAKAKTNDDGKLTATISHKNTEDAVFALEAQAGRTVISYDINVAGQADGEIVEINVFVGANLENVVLYHNSVAMTKSNSGDDQTYTYSPSTGFVTIYTKTFSPFDIAFNLPGNLPLASVSKLDINAISTTWGMGGMSYASDLHVAYSFKTTESYEEALESPYAKYHVDFVVKANKDVKPQAIGLAGYYGAFCDDYNNGNWVSLVSDDAIPANEEIRLLYLMLNGGSVNYEELCNWIPQFDCGAVAFDESAIGTTLTVELRLYEVVDKAESETNSWNEETGEYFTVCKYQYTFDKVAVNPFN